MLNTMVSTQMIMMLKDITQRMIIVIVGFAYSGLSYKTLNLWLHDR